MLENLNELTGLYCVICNNYPINSLLEWRWPRKIKSEKRGISRKEEYLFIIIKSLQKTPKAPSQSPPTILNLGGCRNTRREVEICGRPRISGSLLSASQLTFVLCSALGPYLALG